MGLTLFARQKLVDNHLSRESVQNRATWEGLVVINTPHTTGGTRACLKEAAEARLRDIKGDKRLKDGDRRVIIISREGLEWGVHDQDGDAPRKSLSLSRLRSESLKEVMETMRGKLGAYKRVKISGVVSHTHTHAHTHTHMHSDPNMRTTWVCLYLRKRIYKFCTLHVCICTRTHSHMHACT
jgi:hypothetical protein